MEERYGAALAAMIRRVRVHKTISLGELRYALALGWNLRPAAGAVLAGQGYVATLYDDETELHLPASSALETCVLEILCDTRYGTAHWHGLGGWVWRDMYHEHRYASHPREYYTHVLEYTPDTIQDFLDQFPL